MAVLTVLVLVASLSLFSGMLHAAEEGAEHAEEGWQAATEVPRLINFVIIVFLLWFLLRKPLARYFANRREEIRRLLEEAMGERDRAEAKVEEYREKMRNLEQEVAAMRAESEREREALQRSLLDEARKSAERVVEQARVSIELERKKAVDALKTEASLLALELAEGMLKENISAEDMERINRECIEGLR